MPIPVPMPASGLPYAKLANPKTYVDGHLAWIAEEQERDFATKKPKVYDDGNPVMRDVITLIVTQGNATIKDGGEVRPVQRGDEVLLPISGSNRRDWFKVRKDTGPVNFGDVLRVAYVRDEPSRLGGGNMRHVWTFAFRPADPKKELAEIERCEAIATRMEAAPPRIPVQSPYEDEYLDGPPDFPQAENIDPIPF